MLLSLIPQIRDGGKYPNAHLPHTGFMNLRMTMLGSASPQTTAVSPTTSSQFSKSLKFQKPAANMRKHGSSERFHHPADPCLNPGLHGEFWKSSIHSTCSCFLGFQQRMTKHCELAPRSSAPASAPSLSIKTLGPLKFISLV